LPWNLLASANSDAAYQLCQAVEDGDRAVDRVRESAV
jgi:hypothetical protein